VAVLVAVVTLSTSFAVVSSVGVVSAAVEPVDAVVTETGEALEVAGGLVADAAPLVESGDGFVAQVAGSEVEIPVDAADPLVLDATGGEVAVELPVVPGVGDGVVDESGAVVFESETSPVYLAAQATDDGGLQVLVVIDDVTAPTEYRFDMTVPDGATLRATVDGGAEVVGSDGVVVTAVAPPWAVDANGASVPTSYRIEGFTLVQAVAHHGAVHPVVADPNIGNCVWWQAACTVYFSTIETRRIADGTIGATAVTLACGLAGGPYAAFMCAAHGANLVLGAQNARAQGKCLKVRVYAAYLPPVPGSFTKGTCST
jgi:hypothetical protein